MVATTPHSTTPTLRVRDNRDLLVRTVKYNRIDPGQPARALIERQLTSDDGLHHQRWDARLFGLWQGGGGPGGAGAAVRSPRSLRPSILRSPATLIAGTPDRPPLHHLRRAGMDVREVEVPDHRLFAPPAAQHAGHPRARRRGAGDGSRIRAALRQRKLLGALGPPVVDLGHLRAARRQRQEGQGVRADARRQRSVEQVRSMKTMTCPNRRESAAASS